MPDSRADGLLTFSTLALGRLRPLLETPDLGGTYVPQANDLNKVLTEILELPAEGLSKSTLAAKFHFDPRQALYYIEAARELGLLRMEDARYYLSDEGSAIALAGEGEGARLLGGIVVRLPVIRKCLALILDGAGGGVSREKFDGLVREFAGDRYRGKTLERRTDSVIAWLHWLENASEFVVRRAETHAPSSSPDQATGRPESRPPSSMDEPRHAPTAPAVVRGVPAGSPIFISAATEIHKFPLPNAGFAGARYDVWLFYADVNHLKGMPIPIYANVRKPSLETVAAQAIQDTLTTPSQSARFWAYNGGLVVLASGARRRNRGAQSGLELDIPKRYGLVNGGHTQMAIDSALSRTAPAEAWVRVEAIVGDFSDEEIAAIAEARNTSKNVKEMSLAWKEGKFHQLQRRMRPEFEKRIDWTENQRESEGGTAALTATALIQILMLFDKKHDVNDPPREYAGSLGRPFVTWSDDPRRFGYLDVVCDDILELHDTILATFHANPRTQGLLNCAWGGKQVFSQKYRRPTPFLDLPVDRKMDDGILFPILSAFRVLLEYDEPLAKVRWKARPIETWKQAKGDMMDQVKDSVLSHRSALQVRYDWNLWKSLGLLVEKHKTGNPTNWAGI